MFFFKKKNKPKSQGSRLPFTMMRKALAFFSKRSTKNAVKRRVNTVSLSEPARCFRVRVQVGFRAPVHVYKTKYYEASDKFDATDKNWAGLMDHLDHHITELITRRDDSAIEPNDAAGVERPRRYSVYILIDRDECRWTEQTWVSFQKDPVTMEQAENVLFELQHFVAKFLEHHDPGFVLQDALSRATDPTSLTACIPEAVGAHDNLQPGYNLEVSMRSHNDSGNLHSSATLQSAQGTPLTLTLAKDLVDFSSNIVTSTVLNQGRMLDEEQMKLPKTSFQLMVKVRNNLGPHLHDQSFLLKSTQLRFDHTEPTEFEKFTARIKSHMVMACDRSDGKVESADDLVLKISNVHCENLNVSHLVTAFLDSSMTYDIRVINAILDRVEHSLISTLAGYGLSLQITAHKRGHMVLDKTLQVSGREGIQNPLRRNHTAHLLQDRIEELLRYQIYMVVRDTWVLDSFDERGHPVTVHVPNLDIVANPPTPAVDYNYPLPLPRKTEQLPVHVEQLYTIEEDIGTLALAHTNAFETSSTGTAIRYFTEDEEIPVRVSDAVATSPVSPENVYTMKDEDEEMPAPNIATPTSATTLFVRKHRYSGGEQQVNILHSTPVTTVTSLDTVNGYIEKKQDSPSKSALSLSTPQMIKEYGYLAGQIDRDGKNSRDASPPDDSPESGSSGNQDTTPATTNSSRNTSGPTDASPIQDDLNANRCKPINHDERVGFVYESPPFGKRVAKVTETPDDAGSFSTALVRGTNGTRYRMNPSFWDSVELVSTDILGKGTRFPTPEPTNGHLDCDDESTCSSSFNKETDEEILADSQCKAFDIYASLIMHLRFIDVTPGWEPNPDLSACNVFKRRDSSSSFRTLKKPLMSHMELGGALVPYLHLLGPKQGQ